MTSKIYFSPKTLGFYNESNKSESEVVGTWPPDLVEITLEKREELLSASGLGYTISADTGGNPILIPPPARTQDDLIAETKAKRDELRANADYAIAPLADAVDLGEETEEEIVLLKKWRQYRIALNRLELSVAPEITWPKIPE